MKKLIDYYLTQGKLLEIKYNKKLHEIVEGDNLVISLNDYECKETKQACIKELELAMGKMALSAYHSGRYIDLDYIKHRIEELKKEV